MKTKALLFLCSLFLAVSVRAQWRSETYSLKGGWNAIYLHGDAKQDTIDNLFPNSGVTANVLEIWRWNPNPNAVQFTASPLIPSGGTPEWSVWKRNGGVANTFTQMSGQTAYLVKCVGTAANSYSIPLVQSPLMPNSVWVRNGANLLGFPGKLTGTYPTFANYFASFPAAISANVKIFKYVGGDLTAVNPVQVFAPLTEPVDRTQAYWFDAAVVGNFYAPLEVSLSTTNGFDYGRTGTTITARFRNRTAAPLTVTMAPVNSFAAPATSEGIAGAVPMTLRFFNTATQLYVEAPIPSTPDVVAGPATTVNGTGVVQVIAPQTTVELTFSVNRAHASMTGAAANAYFASFLRLTDSGNLFDIHLPARARKGSLAGLWVGDISVTNVSSQVTNTAKATATVTLGSTVTPALNGTITALTIVGTGGYGYTTAPNVTIAPPASGTTATATAIVAAGSVTGFTITGAGSGYSIAAPKVTIDPPPPLPGTSTPKPFPLRTLLHVQDDGTTRLLSQVYLGTLDVSPNNFGITTKESLLKQDAKATAQRLVAAHLPLDQVITSTSGSVVIPSPVGQPLVCTVGAGYQDATNPFVHQYHPDHDNKDKRFSVTPLAAGVESYDITRTCAFTFTAAPPAGSTVTTGWGSSVIGGTYRETITGVHKQTLQVDGTFELRRASEIGTIATQ